MTPEQRRIEVLERKVRLMQKEWIVTIALGIAILPNAMESFGLFSEHPVFRIQFGMLAALIVTMLVHGYRAWRSRSQDAALREQDFRESFTSNDTNR